MDAADVPPRAPQTLQILVCENAAGLKQWDCGLWDESTLPAALGGIITTPRRYLQAVEHINKIHRKKVWFRSCAAQFLVIMFWILVAIAGTVAAAIAFVQVPDCVARGGSIGSVTALYREICVFRKRLHDRIMRLLAKAVGRANALLCEENVLIGCLTNGALVFVHVPLGACRHDLGRKRFDAAVLKYSCEYTRCLALGQMPFKVSESGHLQGAHCFCQFVRHQKCCWC